VNDGERVHDARFQTKLTIKINLKIIACNLDRDEYSEESFAGILEVNESEAKARDNTRIRIHGEEKKMEPNDQHCE